MSQNIVQTTNVAEKTPEQVTGVSLFLNCISYISLVNIMNFMEKKAFVISYPKSFPYRIQIILDKHTSTFLIKE